MNTDNTNTGTAKSSTRERCIYKLNSNYFITRLRMSYFQMAYCLKFGIKSSRKEDTISAYPGYGVYTQCIALVWVRIMLRILAVTNLQSILLTSDELFQDRTCAEQNLQDSYFQQFRSCTTYNERAPGVENTHQLIITKTLMICRIKMSVHLEQKTHINLY